MATFARSAASAPDEGPRGPADHLRQLRHDPVLLGNRKAPRNEWRSTSPRRAEPRRARVGNYKAVFNLRGDNDAQQTGGLAVESNLGWKGAEKYVAIVPQVFDLWQDPQERYDVFMNNYTEHTWTLVTISEAIKNLMKTYIQYPPRKMQSMGYTGPLELLEVSAVPVGARAAGEGRREHTAADR